MSGSSFDENITREGSYFKKNSVLDESIAAGFENTARGSNGADDQSSIAKHYEEGQIEQPLRIQIITDNYEFDKIVDEWNELADKADVHIFQTYEWLHTWWKHFGSLSRLHILLFYDGDKLIGIVPLFEDSYRVFGKPVFRILRMLGSTVWQPKGGGFSVSLAFSDYLDIIVHPGYEGRVVKNFIQYIENLAGRFDQIELDEVPENSLLSRSFSPALKEKHWDYEITDASVCPCLFLPPSWEEFVSGNSGNSRSQIRRYLRSVTEKNIFRVKSAQTREEIEKAFRLLVKFHQTRWNNLGHPGIFSDRRIYNFLSDVIPLFSKKGWLLFKTIESCEKNKTVSVDLLFKFKKTIYLVQRGFNDESPLSKQSPGNVLLYTEIQEAINNNFRIYDFLRGNEVYKLRGSNAVVRNKRFTIWGARQRQTSKYMLFLVLENYISFKRRLLMEREFIKAHIHKRSHLTGFLYYLTSLLQRGKEKFTDYGAACFILSILSRILVTSL